MGDDDDEPFETEQVAVLAARSAPPRSLTTAQCFVFANGKVGDVLGPLFAGADEFPTRVRLPDGPLMLVDSVRTIEGEPLSMTSGRVVTDHAVRADRWYLDAGRCPVSVTVESGQADLFLAGYLGIDFQTRGLAVYRLLDAVVTFHRDLPKVGETIVYDIRVDEFFRQGESWLFRFRFEGTVNGEPLLSMQNGVAGFFTAQALAAGQGIVHTKLDRLKLQGEKPADWPKLAPVEVTALTQEQVEAVRAGDLVTAFGPAFARFENPQRLPGGMLRLLDRVPLIDPAGGRFGLGFARGEYDIRPAEWFIECHFVDDKVMPGTLMYECCLHTLRVLLMRLGWVGSEGAVAGEPVPGVQSRLKCRGQVLQSTRTVTYEITLKELGANPEPFAVADALMLADGRPIVEITNLSLKLAGVTLAQLAQAWADGPTSVEPAGPPPAFGKDKILAYSSGNPSEAFGEPYKIFDRERVLARLPRPPFQFLDRVASVTGEPFVLKSGAACVAEYDVPRDAWYFRASRSQLMPFSVLLEVALQPCGFLAAYCGSALTSELDLSFRNLGGKATQHRAVTPATGMLTTAVTLTKTANAGGMIIQHYDLNVWDDHGPVTTGATYFGFFTKAALANQVGTPGAKLAQITDKDRQAYGFQSLALPDESPFPAAKYRMIDRVEFAPRGGSHGLGAAVGTIAVDPAAWFFEAHFYQDPVWPGSLGLESFLQLLKFVAVQKYGPRDFQTVALGEPHAWEYRGQVLPSDREVRVHLEVTDEDAARKRLTARGFLVVDGRIIYKLVDFTLE